MSDRKRRTELAKENFQIVDEDPYWLYNLHGKINTDDLEKMVEELREDAALLETAKDKIERDEWLPSEARLFLAGRLNRGDYRADSSIEDIREEVNSDE